MMRNKGGRESIKSATTFIAPAFILYTIFVIAPWLAAIFFSFFNWDGIGEAVWNSYRNYIQVIKDPEQLQSIKNSILLIVFFSFIPVFFGLISATSISNLSAKSKIAKISRVVIFLPQVLPLVAVGISWKLIFSPNGIINQLLSLVGLGRLEKGWLGDFNFAIYAIGIVGIWLGIGLCSLLFSTGIQKIDKHLYESIQIDGGGRIREFTSVTLPSLRPEIRFAITITTISALSGFDLVYVMTNGGPGGKTLVPGLEVFRLAFTYQQFGQACSLAVTLSTITFAFILSVNKLLKDY